MDMGLGLDFHLGSAFSLGKALSLGICSFSGNLDFLLPDTAVAMQGDAVSVGREEKVSGGEGPFSGDGSYLEGSPQQGKGGFKGLMDEFTPRQGLLEKPDFKDGLMGNSRSGKTVPQDLVTPDAYRIMSDVSVSFNSTSTQMLPPLDTTRTVTTPCFDQVACASGAFAKVPSELLLLEDGFPGEIDGSEALDLQLDGSDTDYDLTTQPEFERRRSLRMRRAPTLRSVPTFGSDGEDGKDKTLKERKKVGRPIAYKGDPNSPALTEEERRRVKRRIANRESARRVRQKRQDHLGELQIKVQHIQTQNQNLLLHCNEVEKEKHFISQQLGDMRDKWASAAHENMRLRGELAAVRKALEINIRLMEASSQASGQGKVPVKSEPVDVAS
eukprot:jgi/Botrbrau1/7989/Bobra.384_2s0017.1